MSCVFINGTKHSRTSTLLHLGSPGSGDLQVQVLCGLRWDLPAGGGRVILWCPSGSTPRSSDVVLIYMTEK